MLFRYNFVYQMNNACYESHIVESVQKSNEVDNQTVQYGDETGKNVEPCRQRLRCVYC